MKDKVELCGTYKLTLKNPGKPPVVQQGKNRVVTLGLQKLAALCMAATTQPEWLAIGDSPNATDLAQVALQGSEWQRVLGTQAQTGNAYTLSTTITGAVANRAVEEMGIFSASSGSTMFARFLPSSFTLEVGGVLQVDWQLEFS